MPQGCEIRQRPALFILEDFPDYGLLNLQNLKKGNSHCLGRIKRNWAHANIGDQSIVVDIQNKGQTDTNGLLASWTKKARKRPENVKTCQA